MNFDISKIHIKKFPVSSLFFSDMTLCAEKVAFLRTHISHLNNS